MTICVPTLTKDGLKAQVHDHFGSAPFFTVCNITNGDIRVIDNTNAHHAHGMCQPLKVLGSVAVGAVVCRGMGAGAVHKLNASGIKAYQTEGNTVSEVLEKYKAGILREITIEGSCAGHGCH